MMKGGIFMGRKKVYSGRNGRWNNGNVAGAFDNGNGNGNYVAGAFDNGNGNDVETIIEPTENIVNTTTNNRTIRRVYPTLIENVTRNMVRVENYYPVTQSNRNENIVQEFNCGSDLNNPCCKPVKRCRK
jgi:spore coat protein D